MIETAGQHRIEPAHVRRSPRYGVFLTLGAVVGAVIALVLTLVFDGTQDRSDVTGVVYSAAQVFGFLALFCVPIGLALSGLVALLLDRAASRHVREVRIDHERGTLDER
jgi:chromate transport protein ChrA